MSRYNNVKILLDLANEYDLETVTELLLDEDTSTEEIAEDIAFVVISLWGMVPAARKQAFIERLTDEIVNVEITEMNRTEGFHKDTTCRNCGGAMWWVPEDGWFHDHPHCIDPDPFLSSV